MLNLVEVVQSALSPEISNPIVNAAALIIIGLQGWQIRTTSRLEKEVLKFRVHLFGVNGDNGQNSDVKQQGEKLDRVESRLQSLEDSLK